MLSITAAPRLPSVTAASAAAEVASPVAGVFVGVVLVGVVLPPFVGVVFEGVLLQSAAKAYEETLAALREHSYCFTEEQYGRI